MSVSVGTQCPQRKEQKDFLCSAQGIPSPILLQTSCEAQGQRKLFGLKLPAIFLWQEEIPSTQGKLIEKKVRGSSLYPIIWGTITH
jgi:hypothetical protein